MVAPLAITGASIASSEPVRGDAGGNNTLRLAFQRMRAPAVGNLTRPVGGLNCDYS
ncbi:hypothetical protein HT118_24730 [Escherichia coli]|nr:hypothetical protein [Escherichia coli]